MYSQCLFLLLRLISPSGSARFNLILFFCLGLSALVTFCCFQRLHVYILNIGSPQNQLTAKSHHCFSGKSDLDIVESSLRTPAVSTQTMKLIVNNLSVYLLLFGFIVYSCARVMIYIPPVTKKTTGSLLTLVLLKVSFSCHLRQFLLTLSALETTEHPQTRIIKTCQ